MRFVIVLSSLGPASLFRRHGLLEACLGSPFAQNIFARSPQLYREPPQDYQEDPRYPVPQADQYLEEPPRYQKKYQEEDPDYDESTNTIPGEPGKDYPVYAVIPSTGFSCSDKLPGFYVDEKANCQVWHYCKTDGLVESFLCPNGTIYNQANRVCEWWFNVRCDSDTIAQQYKVNEDLYIIPSPKPDTQYAPAPANHVASRTQYDSEPQYAQDSQYEQYEQPDQPYQGYLQDGF